MTTATTTKERPILFSGPMVQAILDGRKTQTRRIVKPQPVLVNGGRTWDWPKPSPYKPHRERGISAASWANGLKDPAGLLNHLCPFGAPGERLWVRERFSGPWCFEAASGRAAIPPAKWARTSDIWYWADGNPPSGDWTKPRPSIHMPRHASRLTLEIVSVRVERLQEISEEDARAEGIIDGGCTNCGESEPCGCPDPSPDARDAFVRLWDSLNGKRDGCSWADNPWVWVIEFKRVQP